MTFGYPKTTKEELTQWRKGEKRMNSEVVTIDGKMHEKIQVDPNTVIFKPLAEEQLPTRNKRAAKPSDEHESSPG